MDTEVLIALIGLCGLVVSGVLALIGVMLTNSKEKRSSAEGALEKALRERIELKNEQLEDARSDKAELEVKYLESLNRNNYLETENARLRQEAKNSS